MKKIILLFLLIIVLLPDSFSQRRNGLIKRRLVSSGTIMFAVGPAFLHGDPGSPFNDSFNNGVHNWDVSLGYRHRFADGNFSYMVNLDYGNYAGTDEGSEKLAYRKYTNVSNVIELSARGEYSYIFGARYRRSTPSTLYGFFGLGVLNSEIEYNKQYNRGVNYLNANHKIAAFLPFGIGYQYELNPNWFIGTEVGLRYVFSDFVDGLKPPFPSSTANDILNGVKLSIAYKIY
jgi:hypothetical protein